MVSRVIMLSTAAAIMAVASIGGLAAAEPNHGGGGMSHGAGAGGAGMSHGPSMGSSGVANRGSVGSGTTGYGGSGPAAGNHAMAPQGQGGRMVGNGRAVGNRNVANGNVGNRNFANRNFANRNFANGNVGDRGFNGRNDRFAHERGRGVDRRRNRLGSAFYGFGYGYSDDSWDDGEYAYQDCEYANDWRARRLCGPYASSAYGPVYGGPTVVFGW